MLTLVHHYLKMMALAGWGICLGMLIIMVTTHQFLWLLPLIAHNHIQNWLGWDLVIAFELSLASFLVGLVTPRR